MNWENFKNTKIAIKCTSEKERFFSDCEKHKIYNFMGERAMLRDFFVCRLCYKDHFSDGRYEIRSFDEWQIKENGLFGEKGLEVIEYGNNA